MSTKDLITLRNTLSQKEAEIKELEPRYEQLQMEITILRSTLDIMDAKER